jgi:group I intron endonuclease
MAENIGVYQIVCIPTGKRYIGSSNNISKRLWGHIYNLKRNEHHNQHLQYAFNKYGISNFKAEPLFYCAPDERIKLEIMTIETVRPEFNIRPPVDGIFTNSPETRRKLSIANMGKPSPMKGKHHTDAAKEKLRAAKLGQPGHHTIPHTAEAKAKMSLTRTGKPSNKKGTKMSPEQIEKLRIAHLGHHPSIETREKLRITTQAYWDKKHQENQ